MLGRRSRALDGAVVRLRTHTERPVDLVLPEHVGLLRGAPAGCERQRQAGPLGPVADADGHAAAALLVVRRRVHGERAHPRLDAQYPAAHPRAAFELEAGAGLSGPLSAVGRGLVSFDVSGTCDAH